MAKELYAIINKETGELGTYLCKSHRRYAFDSLGKLKRYFKSEIESDKYEIVKLVPQKFDSSFKI